MKKREAKIALTITWDEYRPGILSSIAKALAERMPGQWVAVTSVLPQGLPTRSWRSLWKDAMEVGIRATEYVPVEGYYLLRHKFGNAYFVWCISRDSFSGELDTLVDRARGKTPEGSIPGITELQDIIDSECGVYVDELNKARKLIETSGDNSHSPRKRPLATIQEVSCAAALTKKARRCLTTDKLSENFQQRDDTEETATASRKAADSNRLGAEIQTPCCRDDHRAIVILANLASPTTPTNEL